MTCEAHPHAREPPSVAASTRLDETPRRTRLLRSHPARVVAARPDGTTGRDGDDRVMTRTAVLTRSQIEELHPDGTCTDGLPTRWPSEATAPPGDSVAGADQCHDGGHADHSRRASSEEP